MEEVLFAASHLQPGPGHEARPSLGLDPAPVTAERGEEEEDGWLQA